MGMFDVVKLEQGVELPDGYTGRSFQTKDLGCDLDLYRITASGRLEVLRCDLEPDGPPRLDRDFRFERQFYRRVNERWVEQDFHGRLNFYGGDHRDDWREYFAKFTDGQLMAIAAVERRV